MNSPFFTVGIVVFILFWLTGVVAWFYSLVELKRFSRRDPQIFSRGAVTLRESLPGKCETDQMSAEAGSLDGVDLVPLAEDVAGFVPRLKLVRPITNLLPYAATLAPADGHTDLIVRMPVGLIVFFASCLLGTLLLGILPSQDVTLGASDSVRQAGVSSTTLKIALGFSIGLAVCVFRIVVGRRQARHVASVLTRKQVRTNAV